MNWYLKRVLDGLLHKWHYHDENENGLFEKRTCLWCWKEQEIDYEHSYPDTNYKDVEVIMYFVIYNSDGDTIVKSTTKEELLQSIDDEDYGERVFLDKISRII